MFIWHQPVNGIKSDCNTAACMIILCPIFIILSLINDDTSAIFSTASICCRYSHSPQRPDQYICWVHTNTMCIYWTGDYCYTSNFLMGHLFVLTSALLHRMVTELCLWSSQIKLGTPHGQLILGLLDWQQYSSMEINEQKLNLVVGIIALLFYLKSLEFIFIYFSFVIAW